MFGWLWRVFGVVQTSVLAAVPFKTCMTGPQIRQSLFDLTLPPFWPELCSRGRLLAETAVCSAWCLITFPAGWLKTLWPFHSLTPACTSAAKCICGSCWRAASGRNNEWLWVFLGFRLFLFCPHYYFFCYIRWYIRLKFFLINMHRAKFPIAWFSAWPLHIPTSQKAQHIKSEKAFLLTSQCFLLIPHSWEFSSAPPSSWSPSFRFPFLLSHCRQTSTTMSQCWPLWPFFLLFMTVQQWCSFCVYMNTHTQTRYPRGTVL